MTAGPNRDAGKRLVPNRQWYGRCRDVAEFSRRTELAMIGARLRGDVRIVLWNGPPLLPGS